MGDGGAGGAIQERELLVAEIDLSRTHDTAAHVHSSTVVLRHKARTLAPRLAVRGQARA